MLSIFYLQRAQLFLQVNDLIWIINNFLQLTFSIIYLFNFFIFSTGFCTFNQAASIYYYHFGQTISNIYILFTLKLLMRQMQVLFSALMIFSLLFTLNSQSANPVWSVYDSSIMYTGQYQAYSTLKAPGLALPGKWVQDIYRSDVPANKKYTQPPKVILTLLGYKQNPPASLTDYVGFAPIISDITASTFTVLHDIYGGGIVYQHYMYMTLVSTNTDFNLGSYVQLLDTTQTNKSYSFDIAYNPGQTYPNYLINKIQMKGFLTGYKIQEGTAGGIYLNFTLKLKDALYFTIQVSCDPDSILQKITFSRIGYDRTAIERKTHNDIFQDFYFQLKNNVNTGNVGQVGFLPGEFQYRNFLMGTNKINIDGVNAGSPTTVQYFLYYYFAQSLAKVALATQANPAIAKYLYGDSFYHAIKSCADPAYPLYLSTDRKCYASCPATGFFADTNVNTCLPCHFSCSTCSKGYEADSCLTCKANFRKLQVVRQNTTLCTDSATVCTNIKVVNGITVCTQCPPTYNLILAGGRNICIKRVNHCKTQDYSSGFCKQCVQNFTLIQTDNACVELIKECENYTTDGECQDCKEGFKFNSDDNRCVPDNTNIAKENKCPDGQLPNQNDTCVDGNINKCTKYLLSGACDKCQKDYLYSSQKNLCELQEACAEFNPSTGKKYRRNSRKQCVEVQNLCGSERTDFNDDGTCRFCVQGFYPFRGVCYPYK